MVPVSNELASFASEARRFGLVLSAEALERAADLTASSERERPIKRSRPDEVEKEKDISNG